MYTCEQRISRSAAEHGAREHARRAAYDENVTTAGDLFDRRPMHKNIIDLQASDELNDEGYLGYSVVLQVISNAFVQSLDDT